MASLTALALAGSCAVVQHPFLQQQSERAVHDAMWWQDRHGVNSAAKLGLGPAPQFFTQYQDHFDGTNKNTWQQAYYQNATYYRPGGPVFLCVGGEGPPIDGSAVVYSVHCNNAVEFLQESGAMMFALEHRYYGCHNRSACPVADPTAEGGLKYLSSRQALGDLARFRTYAADRFNLTGKWVTWGGSYPGMLAGWFRLKFPHLIHASVASSAPVKAALDMVGYNDVVAAAYSVSDNGVGGSPQCTANIADGHAKIKAMFETAAGRQTLSELFGNSPNWYSSHENQAQFAGNGVAYFPAQGNDPACTRPACNIKKICEVMTDSSLGDNVHKLRALTRQQDMWAARKWELPRAPAEADYWGYQTCTEFAFYQTCEVGSKCMFAQGYVTVETMDAFCREWGIDTELVSRNVDYTNAYYGGDKPAGTCVVYPNGEVDPWQALSVLKSPSKGIPVMMVPGASHHAWTHPTLPTDQVSVVKARGQLRDYVKQFLAQDCNQATI